MQPSYRIRYSELNNLSLSNLLGSLNSNGDPTQKIETLSTGASISFSGPFIPPTTLIDTRSTPLNISLPQLPVSYIGTQKRIQLSTRRSDIATISAPRGTFQLTPTDDYKDVLYTENGWKIMDSRTTSDSFYPTTGTAIFTDNDTQKSAFITNGGNTLIIGSPLTNSNAGNVTIYTLTGTNNWIQRSQFTGVGNMQLGYEVTASSDGSVIVASAPRINGNTGPNIFVYQRQTNYWNLIQSFSSTGFTGGSPIFFGGVSLATSADGNFIAFGTPNVDNQYGAAFIWSRTGGYWYEVQKLIGTEGTGSNIGSSMALSSDASTIVIGGDAVFGHGLSLAWVFSRSGTTWNSPWIQSQIISPSGDNTAAFGISTSLSADGSILAIGSPVESTIYTYKIIPSGSGSVYMFNQRLFKKDNIFGSDFGEFVTLSADGYILVATENVGSGQPDRYLVYRRDNDVWNLIQSTNLSGDSQTPYDLSISDNGNAVAVSFDNSVGIYN